AEAGFSCSSAAEASALGASAVGADDAIESALSPSSRRTAIRVLTLTFSVPAATSSLPITPSSTASTSMVALSVSISAITSPEATLSPSFFSHLLSVPSSMVGERAGIRISIGIIVPSPRSQQNIGVELGCIRLRIVLGKIGAVRDDVADVLVDRLQIVLAGP